MGWITVNTLQPCAFEYSFEKDLNICTHVAKQTVKLSRSILEMIWNNPKALFEVKAVSAAMGKNYKNGKYKLTTPCIWRLTFDFYCEPFQEWCTIRKVWTHDITSNSWSTSMRVCWSSLHPNDPKHGHVLQNDL